MDASAHKIYPDLVKNRFANYPGEKLHNIILPSCAMYVKKLLRSRAHHKAHLSAWQALNEPLAVPHTQGDVHPEITWIGHASFLIKMGSHAILTDPVFGDLTVFFPRLQAPGIYRDALPPITAVLISHNHPDHLEKSTMLYLARTHNPLFLVPQGDKALFAQWGITRVVEHTWWEQSTVTLAPESDASELPLTLTFLPAHHWSGRWLLDTNRSLWGSWMISYNGYHCYFAGDTAYSNHFRAIAHEFPAIHTAIMPIAPCEPSEHVRKSHMNAEEAGAAFLELKAHCFIPMHWGTFSFGIDHPLDPIHRLESWWNRTFSESSPQLFLPLRVGQPLLLQGNEITNNATAEQQVCL